MAINEKSYKLSRRNHRSWDRWGMRMDKNTKQRRMKIMDHKIAKRKREEPERSETYSRMSENPCVGEEEEEAQQRLGLGPAHLLLKK